MKNTTEILQEYKARERAEHINIDDILNKVTQEIIELLEGIKNNDMENITEEAGDVLINLLSFASEL
jgi:NTP pyrophosphatase (non-canonical NTP hydrolase)